MQNKFPSREVSEQVCVEVWKCLLWPPDVCIWTACVPLPLLHILGWTFYWRGNDSCLLCTTAFKLYPLRVRVVNVITDEVRFVTVAYIPVVRKRTEAGAEEKARRRRSAVLQRVLYLAFRTAIGASHSGKEVLVGDRVLLAFPRILLYLADLPEEKAVLCINSGE